MTSPTAGLLELSCAFQFQKTPNFSIARNGQTRLADGSSCLPKELALLPESLPPEGAPESRKKEPLHSYRRNAEKRVAQALRGIAQGSRAAPLRRMQSSHLWHQRGLCGIHWLSGLLNHLKVHKRLPAKICSLLLHRKAPVLAYESGDKGFSVCHQNLSMDHVDGFLGNGVEGGHRF
jgi:hypothetical protein